MNRKNLKLIRPMILIFIFLNAFFLLGRDWLAKKGIDEDVLIIGNMLLFLVSLISFLITQHSLQSKNPNAFVRAMYGGFIIKFFVVAIAAFIYIMMAKKNVNKPALFSCMGLYIIYTFFEVSALLRVLKQKKNA
jgi:hypothetical protein